MPKLHLPERPSLEYLKRRAKEQLVELRQRDAKAKLAAAQLSVARDYGFPSWRALKAEVDRRRAPAVESYFAACRAGDAGALRALLAAEPSLVGERNAEGATGLHVAVRHLEAVRALLDHGADPNARDLSDNAYPLHAAGTRSALVAGAAGQVHARAGDLEARAVELRDRRQRVQAARALGSLGRTLVG